MMTISNLSLSNLSLHGIMITPRMTFSNLSPQLNNPSHSVVSSPSGIRNMKQTLPSRFLHCVAPHLASGILPLTDNYGTTIKSLHIKAVSDSKSVLSHSHVIQTASPQIALEEANLPRPYRRIMHNII